MEGRNGGGNVYCTQLVHIHQLHLSAKLNKQIFSFFHCSPCNIFLDTYSNFVLTKNKIKVINHISINILMEATVSDVCFQTNRTKTLLLFFVYIVHQPIF